MFMNGPVGLVERLGYNFTFLRRTTNGLRRKANTLSEGDPTKTRIACLLTKLNNNNNNNNNLINFTIISKSKMANWYDLKSQPAAASGLNLSRNEQHQFLDQKIPMRQQQQQQLHIHRALSMQMGSPRPINAFDALTRASAERRNYLLTANINPHQKPGQPAPLTNSSPFFNKTLSLLQSHAQSSRLHNLATTAANTSRALESARKKMIRMEERCVLPSIATCSDSSKEEEAAHLSEPTDNDV